MYRIKHFKTDKSTLYLVSTPIGHLDDMTFRAIDTLQSVDFIFAEDTRVAQKLLKHYEIKTKPQSYHEHNKEIKTEEIIGLLKEGKHVAIMSDAGMPVISDPGYELVVAAIQAEIPVVPIPGANAALTALIASGIPPKPFTYIGFLDHKEQKRKQELAEYQYLNHTIVLYESIHRLESTLKLIHEVLGDRTIVIGRELTKLHEEFTYGKVSDILEDLPESKGEVVIVIGHEEKEIQKSIEEQLDELISLDVPVMDAIKQVAKTNGLKKGEVYNIYHKK